MKSLRATRPKLKAADPGSVHLFRRGLELEALLETARQLSETLNLRTVCDTAFRRLAEMVRHDETLLLEPDEDGIALKAVARRFTDIGVADEEGWRTDYQPLLVALREERSLSMERPEAGGDPAAIALARAGLASFLAVPVAADGAAAALLVLGRRKNAAFGAEERESAERIATLLGYALQNARRHDQLQQAYARLHELTRDRERRNRSERLGMVAAGAVREINSALSPVLEFSDLLAQETARGDLRHLSRYLQHIRTASGEAAEGVRRLAAFLQSAPAGESPVDLNATVKNAIEITRPRWESLALAGGTEIRLRVNFGSLPVLRTEAGSLLDAITDIIFALVEGLATRSGVLSFRTRRAGGVAIAEMGCSPLGREQASGSRLLPETGVAQEHHLDDARAGIARIGGTLDSEPTENGGILFTLTLPLGAIDEVRGDAGPAAAEGEPARRLRLLVAEDEPLVREALCAALTQMGHAVLSAADGEEAAARLRPGYFDALLTDRSMPRLNGDRLAALAGEVDPGLPVILLSGFGEMMLATGERPPGVTRVLGKPFTSASLRAALGGLCRRPDPS